MPAGNSLIPLAYIASPSFSGSTLLTFLLNAHPEIATIGELKWGRIDLKNYQCSCGALLAQCPFFTTLVDEMRRRELPFELAWPQTDFRCRGHWADRIARARVGGRGFEAIRAALLAVIPICQRSWPTIAGVNEAVIETTLAHHQARCFLDGSKDPTRIGHLAATGRYELRVIHLIRDVRGVSNSSIQNAGLSAEDGARDWVSTHRQIERVTRRMPPDRVVRIRYEDLCANRTGTLQRICRCLGVDSDTIIDDFGGVEHHILGNRMRLRVGGDQVTVDEKWKRMLSAEALQSIEKVAGALNREYGYE